MFDKALNAPLTLWIVKFLYTFLEIFWKMYHVKHLQKTILDFSEIIRFLKFGNFTSVNSSKLIPLLPLKIRTS